MESKENFSNLKDIHKVIDEMSSKLKISAFISVIGCIDDVILIIIPTVIFMTMFKQEMDFIIPNYKGKY